MEERKNEDNIVCVLRSRRATEKKKECLLLSCEDNTSQALCLDTCMVRETQSMHWTVGVPEMKGAWEAVCAFVQINGMDNLYPLVLFPSYSDDAQQAIGTQKVFPDLERVAQRDCLRPEMYNLRRGSLLKRAKLTNHYGLRACRDIPFGVVLGQLVGVEMMSPEWRALRDANKSGASYPDTVNDAYTFRLTVDDGGNDATLDVSSLPDEITWLALITRMSPMDPDAKEQCNAQVTSVMVDGWPRLMIVTTKHIRRDEQLIALDGHGISSIDTYDAIEDFPDHFPDMCSVDVSACRSTPSVYRTTRLDRQKGVPRQAVPAIDKRDDGSADSDCKHLQLIHHGTATAPLWWNRSGGDHDSENLRDQAPGHGAIVRCFGRQ